MRLRAKFLEPEPTFHRDIFPSPVHRVEVKSLIFEKMRGYHVKISEDIAKKSIPILFSNHYVL